MGMPRLYIEIVVVSCRTACTGAEIKLATFQVL
jgi:hypothetical protein